MTKTRKPLFSLNAKGKLGPLVISRSLSGSHKVAVKRPPANPKSPAQLLIRDYYGSGVETYRTLDTAERLYYHNLYPRQRGHRAYLNFMKEWLMAKLPLHAPDHAETGRDPIDDPLDLDAIPNILTGKDADTLDGYHAVDLPGPVPHGRPAAATYSYFSIPGATPIGVAPVNVYPDILWYYPILVTTAITLDQLAMMVTSPGATGTLARLGIYTANINWQPLALLLDAGTVLIDSNGVKTKNIALTLPPGRYLLAWVANGNFQLHGIIAALPTTHIRSTIPDSPFPSHLLRAFPYAPLPDPPPPWNNVLHESTPTHYTIMVRISTP